MFILRDCNTTQRNSIKLNVVLNFVRILSNIGFPLLVVPFVTRTLGPLKFGELNYYMAIMAIMTVVTTLGVSVFGLKNIRFDNECNIKNSLDINNLILVRFVLCCSFSFILFIYGKFSGNISITVVFLIFISIVFEIILCDWVYIGLKDQKAILIRTFISKLLFLVVVVVFLDKNSTPESYLLIHAIVNGCFSFISFFYLFSYKYGESVKFKFTFTYSKAKEVFLLGGIVFLSSYFGKFDIIWMFDFISENEYAYFSSSYKLVLIVLTVVTSVSMIILPYLSTSKSYSDEINVKSINYIFFFSFVIGSFISFNSDVIVCIVFGEEFYSVGSYLKVMSILIFLVPFYNAVTYQVLLKNGEENKAVVFYLVSIVLSVVVFFLSNQNFMLSTLVSNVLLFSLAMYSFVKNGMKISLYKQIFAVVSTLCILMYFFSACYFFGNFAFSIVFLLCLLSMRGVNFDRC